MFWCLRKVSKLKGRGRITWSMSLKDNSPMSSAQLSNRGPILTSSGQSQVKIWVFYAFKLFVHLSTIFLWVSKRFFYIKHLKNRKMTSCIRNFFNVILDFVRKIWVNRRENLFRPINPLKNDVSGQSFWFSIFHFWFNPDASGQNHIDQAKSKQIPRNKDLRK